MVTLSVGPLSKFTILPTNNDSTGAGFAKILTAQWRAIKANPLTNFRWSAIKGLQGDEESRSVFHGFSNLLPLRLAAVNEVYPKKKQKIKIIFDVFLQQYKVLDLT
jgi:hypothetical protein